MESGKISSSGKRLPVAFESLGELLTELLEITDG
jgi:hypothetical protein